MENKKDERSLIKAQNGFEKDNKDPNNKEESEHVEKPQVPFEKESQPLKQDQTEDEQEQVQVEDNETTHTETQEEATPLIEDEEKREPQKEYTLDEKGKESQKDKQAKASKPRKHRSYLETFSSKKKPQSQEKKISLLPKKKSSDVISESEEQTADVAEPPRREEKVEENSLSEDPVNNVENMVDGVVTSVISKLASHPLDVLQKRYQLAQIPRKRPESWDLQKYLENLKHKKDTYRSIIYNAKVLYIERGLRGFYKGLTQALFVNIFQTTTLFWTFEHLRPILNKQPLTENALLLNFAAGFVSGAAAGFVAHPFHRIVQHMHATSKLHEKQSTMRVVYRILRTDGYRKFYRGITPTMLHVSPLHGFKFMFYNIFCDYELEKPEYENRDEIPALSLLTAGAAAGLISNYLTFPLDLIRQRLQMSSLIRQRYHFDATCRSIGQCLVLVVQREGFFALYRGVVPCLLRSSVNTAVQFSVFDKMHQWARNDYDLHVLPT